jgi:hypothetical protein
MAILSGRSGTVACLLVLWLAGLAPVAAAEPAVYLCVADQAAGFSFSRQQRHWTPMVAQGADKLLVNRSRRPGARWEVKSVEGRYPFAWCARDFDAAGVLDCEGAGGTVRVNRASGRFLRVLPYGGWTSARRDVVLSQSGGRVPYLLMGSCTGL